MNAVCRPRACQGSSATGRSLLKYHPAVAPHAVALFSRARGGSSITWGIPPVMGARRSADPRAPKFDSLHTRGNDPSLIYQGKESPGVFNP
eukprot:1172509-Pyramimonas_sp.AAC.1